MILFTGMTGLSGIAFVDVLKKHGFSERFRVFVRETSDIEQLKKSGLDYELAYGSLENETSLTNAMIGCDVVFHIASKGNLKEICSSAIKAKSIKQCILISSTSIYSQYRKASYLSNDEKVVKEQLKENGISWTIIRPTMIFGSINDSNISTFMKWLDVYPVFPIVKNGSALLQPVYRYDLAEAYYLVLINRNKCVNEEFIVSGKEPITLKEMLQKISNSIGRKTAFINVPFNIANAGVNILCWLTRGSKDYKEKLFRLTENRAFNHDKISKRFGYTPKDFDEGLNALACEFLNNKKLKSNKK